MLYWYGYHCGRVVEMWVWREKCSPAWVPMGGRLGCTPPPPQTGWRLVVPGQPGIPASRPCGWGVDRRRDGWRPLPAPGGGQDRHGRGEDRRRTQYPRAYASAGTLRAPGSGWSAVQPPSYCPPRHAQTHRPETGDGRRAGAGGHRLTAYPALRVGLPFLSTAG